jgi:hypothetical protein
MTDARELPTVNINGTAMKDLVGQHLLAIESLRVVLGYMREVAPHGRDYPGRDADHALAQRTHRGRVNAIEGMIETMMGEAEMIAQQNARRN